MTNYNNKKLKKQGFSLTEALIGILIIGATGLSVFMLISTSNQTNLTDYYRLTAESMVKEVIEVFNCLGYDELEGRKNTTVAGYSLDVWQEMDNKKSEIPRPEITNSFMRKITLEPVSKSGVSGLIVKVEIKPKDLIMRGLGTISGTTILVKKERL
jgi:hypothetical protein